MAIKTIFENPTIADMVIIPIRTPDADGCLLADPFQVDNVKIYYLSRNFNTPSNFEFEETATDEDLLRRFDEAKQLACEVPIQSNIDEAELLAEEVLSATKFSNTFFTEAVSSEVIGNEDFPAWLSTDTDNSRLIKVEEDEDGNPLFGRFDLEWKPNGQREGDYIVCWTWTLLPAGDKMSAHLKFSLGGATQLTTAIPTHQTDPEKYNILLERYTADVFKSFCSTDDVTPYVIQGLNESAGDGFRFLEDLSNQLLDIIDANATSENFLPLLSNLFNLRLKSNDPTLWRRQIKTAIPLYKKKGTYNGLVEAFDQAGMKLTAFTKLWQVVSDYTYQEAIDVTVDGQTEFTLTNVMILPLDTANFELSLRGVDDDDYTILSSDYVTFSTSGGVTTMTWVGNNLSIGPIVLEEGDTVKVLYEIVEVPPADQTVEDYIRTLPLSDLRDERDQDYPLKNWNVRLIEETDPLFSLIIPVKDPFHEPLIYGWVRTEIAYSENIYNMEEYNGSKRQSRLPCDIDRDFLDGCGDCQSSKYNIDLEIQEISKDRILEALDVLDEFTPFHSQLHTINLSGSTNDFIPPPIETIETLITFVQDDYAISGNGANLIFNRVMLPGDQLERDMMADSSLVVSATSGTALNNEIVLFSPNVIIGGEGIGETGNLLEVLSPSPNSGEYTLINIEGNYATISGGDPIVEPLIQSDFTFRISDEIFVDTSSDVFQDNEFIFEDANVDYSALGVKTQFDVDTDPDYTGGVWKISIPAYSDSYEILNILSDGTLELLDPSSTLPSSTTSGITYSVLDDSALTIDSSTTGKLNVTSRGRVDVTGLTGPGGILDDVRNLMQLGDYLLLGGTQYKVTEFVTGETQEFYIGSYSGGDMVGVMTTALRRQVDNATGKFAYRGLTLETTIDYESSLGILNGVNAPVDENLILEDDKFKENFLVLINPLTTPVYYVMDEIDTTTITLGGLHEDWTTSTAGGTPVLFDIYRFTKPPISIPARTEPEWPGHDFDFIDRRGNVIIDSEQETVMPMGLRAASLNGAKDDQAVDLIGQEETISFNIETADGKAEKGEI